MLQNIEGPFGIISVAGMYRTGKSYLLNKILLDRKPGETGFQVGPSVNPCTKGLWIWGRPQRGFDTKGNPINVLVIDSEGIGALDEDSNHDAKIFSLCILLSSYFMYNSMNSIDEASISNLNLVLHLTKNIHLKSTGNNEELDAEEYSQYFPSFMWIVRDFALQMVDNFGEEIDVSQYLENALAECKGFSESIEEKNRIRRLIKSFFKDRSCYTMIRPVTNEENLQNLESMDESEIRKDFLDQVVKLRNRVTHSIKPKTLNGQTLTPGMYITLAQSYVEALNTGAVPNIENAWKYICQNECKKSLDNAVSHFDASFCGKVLHDLPMEETAIRDWYREAKEECRKTFIQN